jgi:hypothetical protein
MTQMKSAPDALKTGRIAMRALAVGHGIHFSLLLFSEIGLPCGALFAGMPSAMRRSPCAI